MSSQQAQHPQPRCKTSLTGDDSEWREKDASTIPPGYSPLCKGCFPDADRDEGGFDPDYDHTEVTDTIIRAAGTNSSSRHLHRPRE